MGGRFGDLRNGKGGEHRRCGVQEVFADGGKEKGSSPVVCLEEVGLREHGMI